MRTTTEVVLALRRHGLSQSEIARRTGIPQPRISRWEAGEAPDAADGALRLLDLCEQLDAATMGSSPKNATDQQSAEPALAVGGAAEGQGD